MAKCTQCNNEPNEILQAQCKQYFHVINSIKESIITTDNFGIILECNRATEKIFGWNKEELIGKSVMVLIPPHHKETYISEINRYKETGNSLVFGQDIDTEGLTKDDIIVPIGLSIVPVQTENNLLFCSVIRDISHRKINEKQIHMLNEFLKVRVSALEAFQFSVVHDLNAPLRSLEGFSEILEEDYMSKLDKNAKDYLRRISESVKRMRQLINDMLRLSRVTQPSQDLYKENVNLSEIAQTIMEEHAEFYNPTKRDYQFIVEPNVVDYCDKELISVVIMNLISNAWKFSSKQVKSVLEFGAKKAEGRTVYFVKDNGVGFEMSKADKLFKPFSRLHDKKEFDGNGVGLAIVRQIILLHEGEVWAEGKVGQGATFYFTIGNQKHAGAN